MTGEHPILGSPHPSKTPKGGAASGIVVPKVTRGKGGPAGPIGGKAFNAAQQVASGAASPTLLGVAGLTVRGMGKTVHDHPVSVAAGAAVTIGGAILSVENPPLGAKVAARGLVIVGGAGPAGPPFESPRNLRLPHPSWFSKGGGNPVNAKAGLRLLRNRSYLHLRARGLVDKHRARFSETVEAKTAPSPQFRRTYQSSFDRVAMDVPQFFNLLLLAPHNEVIKPGRLGRLAHPLSHRGRVAHPCIFHF